MGSMCVKETQEFLKKAKIELLERIDPPPPPPPPPPPLDATETHVDEAEDQAAVEAAEEEKRRAYQKAQEEEAKKQKELKERREREKEERLREKERKRKEEEEQERTEELEEAARKEKEQKEKESAQLKAEKEKENEEVAKKKNEELEKAQMEKEKEKKPQPSITPTGDDEKGKEDHPASFPAPSNQPATTPASPTTVTPAAAAATASAISWGGATLWNGVDHFKQLQKQDHTSDDDDDAGASDKNNKVDANPNACAMKGELTPLFDSSTPIFSVKDKQKMGFFNNTDDYDLIVKYKFGPSSKIKALGETNFSTDPSDGWFVATLTTHPRSTAEFVEGTPNGYSSSYSARAVSDEYKQQVGKKQALEIEKEIKAVKALGLSESDDPSYVLQKCLENNVPYIDLQFPPCDRSLCSKADESHFKLYSWAKPSQYLEQGKQQPKLFSGGIDPNDIQQGALGDCYFCCSIAAIGEFDDCVREKFKHPVPFKKGREIRKQEQRIGAYRVLLNKGGWWRNIILDSYFPFSVSAPVFAKNVHDKQELWISLLEKAQAKSHGNYCNIVGGDALFALSDLTGFPSMRIPAAEWKSNGTAFQTLLAGDKAGYLLNINTPGFDESCGAGKNESALGEKYKAAGLGPGHAYTVLKVVEVKSKKLRLLQIRNPWGNGTEWTGAWSDDSDLWQQHPDVAAQCRYSPGADGTFWMTFEDCLNYFDGGGVCHYRPDWTDYRVKGQWVKGVPNVAFEILWKGHKPLKVVFVLSQLDRRGHPDGANYCYEAMLITVATNNSPNKKQYVAECHSSSSLEPTKEPCFMSNRDTALEYEIKPCNNNKKGTSSLPILVVPRCYDDAASKPKEFVFGILTNEEVDQNLFSVKFKALPNDFPMLKHYEEYEYEPGKTGKEVEREFQVKAPKCAPVTATGKELCPRGGLAYDAIKKK